MERRISIKQGWSFFIRMIKAYLSKGRFIPNQAPHLSIETTNLCDAKCVFCANSITQRPRIHLDMSVFKKVVQEFVALGGINIDFNATIGEPLLDPNLLERARYAKQFSQFASLGFVTNLQWLHKFDIDEFFAAGFTWLGISTVLSGREKYREFFGVDRYLESLKNILLLMEKNNQQKNKIILRFSLKPTNEPLGAVINHPDFKLVSSLVDYDLVQAVRNDGFFCDDWIGAVKLPSYLKRRPLYPRLWRPCRVLYSGLIVFSNGNIGACPCRDFEANSELILGNAKEMNLKDAWEGEKIKRIRLEWRRRNKIPEICKHCAHYLY